MSCHAPPTSASSSSASPPIQITPSYSYLSDKLRRISAGSLQCSLFCGGRNCKYECSGRWAEQDKALEGLFSHWVTPNILAMARPSTHMIKHGSLLAEFKRHGIGSVINLQLPQEHAKCGPGLEPASGFTYCPEEFMNNGVFFYNYGWKDYGVPTFTSILDMVKVMDFALGEGKVAVHCHAGLGRTGVLIACYLAYSQRLSAPDAIAMVRHKRPGSIQTRQQIQVVHDFASFLAPLWVFCPSSSRGVGVAAVAVPPPPSPSPSPPPPGHTLSRILADVPPPAATLRDLIRNQVLLLHGPQPDDITTVPKVVYEVCGRLAELVPCGGSAHVSHDCACSCEELVAALEDWFAGQHSNQDKVLTLVAHVNASLQWDLLHSEPSPAPLLSLLSLFLHSLKEPVLSPDDDIPFLLHPPLLFQSKFMECKSATVLRVANALGRLLCQATAPPPGAGDAGEATPTFPELHGRAAVKLAADLHQCTSGSAPERTADAFMQYWREMAA